MFTNSISIFLAWFLKMQILILVCEVRHQSIRKTVDLKEILLNIWLNFSLCFFFMFYCFLFTRLIYVLLGWFLFVRSLIYIIHLSYFDKQLKHSIKMTFKNTILQSTFIKQSPVIILTTISQFTAYKLTTGNVLTWKRIGSCFVSLPCPSPPDKALSL